MNRGNVSVLAKIVSLTILLLLSVWIVGGLLDAYLAQLAYQSKGKNLPTVSAWCVNHLKGVAVCDSSVTKLMLLPWLAVVLYSALCVRKLDDHALVHFLAVFLLAALVTASVTVLVACALYAPLPAILSLFEPDNPPLTAVQRAIHWSSVTLSVGVGGAAFLAVFRRRRNDPRLPNKASDATSEPAPGAGSSAHQG